MGITSGVVFSPAVAASRGNISKLMSNTLDSKIIEIDSYDENGLPNYKVSDSKSMITAKLNLFKINFDNQGFGDC